MASDPSTVQNTETKSDNWFKSLIRPIVDSFERNPCNGTAYELGLEASLVTYFAMAYGFKRKQSAFKYSMVALLLVPLIAWPVCVASKQREEVEQLKLREL